ncbi:PEBP-like protein [Clavulina sp. PMI_390]|nr:PEBP-like protein [Clavulina sp. PMI_390]
MLSVASVVAALATVAVAAPTATYIQELAVVRQQFINSYVVPDVIPAFNPMSLITASFNKTTPISNGENFPVASTQPQPSVKFDTIFSLPWGPKYTLLMIDGNYVGSSNPNGLNLHWLQNDVVIKPGGDWYNTTTGIIDYYGPAPASGTGPHRYTILLFQQPSNFIAPATPSRSGPRVPSISLSDYIAAANLKGPYAGIYFTTEIGTTTVTPSATQPVNTAALFKTLAY